MSQDPYIIENPPKRKPSWGTLLYDVTLVTNIEGNTPSVKTLNYTLSTHSPYEGCFEKWKKTNIKIDGSSQYKIIDEIYLKVSEITNNISFNCTEQGILTDINDYQKIVKEWDALKQRIYKSYTGVVVENILVQMENNLHNYPLLKQLLNRDLVLQHLYSSSLNDYLIYYGKSTKQCQYTGVIDTIALPYLVQETLSTTEDKQLQLEQVGTLRANAIDANKLATYLVDKVSDVKTNAFNAKMQASIILDYKTILIKQAEITHTVWLADSNYKKTQTLTLKSI